MTTSRLLLNLNRNATTVDRLVMQLTTGKRIQNPSDNPIIASRALRFRTNVAEVQQFQRNPDKAVSWMEVSEQALRNVTDVMERINELLVQGASGTYTFENRQTISREIQMLFEQMNMEMNGSFAGRHIFSGFRTDQPPIITQNNPDAHFSITKALQITDMERNTMRTWRDATGTLIRIPEVNAADPSVHPQGLNILKVPYKNVGNINIPGFTVNTVSINSASQNPYIPAAGTINFIPETGELVFSAEAMERFTDATPATMVQMTPVAPTPPNPFDAASFPGNDLDPVFAQHWNDYLQRLSDFNVRNTAAQAQMDEFQVRYAQYTIDRAQFEVDMAAFERGDLDVPPLEPPRPIPPTMPTPPTPPNIDGMADYAAYLTAYDAYLVSMDNQNTGFNAYWTNFDNYRQDLIDWHDDVAAYVAGGGTLEDALIAHPRPTTLTPQPANLVDPYVGPPVPQSVGASIYTHTSVDPRFAADFDAFMVSFNHFQQDMRNQHNIREQMWAQQRATANRPGINIQYTVQGIFQGELNPLVFFNTIDFNRPILDANGDPTGQYQLFSQDNQNMQFELGTNTRMTINTQAKDAYPWQLFADMRTFIELIDRIELGDFSGLTPEQRAAAEAEERVIFAEGLYQKFTNMISLLEGHIQTTTTEFTALGSRMNRVDLIANRLDENEDTFIALMSQNENVDYIEALMRFNAAEAVLQAAMQVGARIAQVSLVNFI